MRAFGLIIGLLVLAAYARAEDDALVAAARQREQTFRSVTFEIEVVEFVAKGQLNDLSEKKVEATVPAKDLEVRSRNRLVLDGQKARYEDNHPMWSVSTHEFLNNPSIFVTDGVIGKQFFPSGISGAGKRADGLIDGNNMPGGTRSAILTPLTVHSRGLSPTLAPYVVTDLKRTETILPLGGHRCREYVWKQASDSTTSLFVDEEEEFVIRRVRKMRQGQVYYQDDINYKREPLGLIPASWTLTEYNRAGKLMRRKAITVIDFASHQMLPPDQFDLTFPEGAHVYDRRTVKHYVVQPSGMLRQIERDGSYIGDEIHQPGASWLTRNSTMLLWVGVGVLGLGIGAFLLKRKRARGPQQV